MKRVIKVVLLLIVTLLPVALSLAGEPTRLRVLSYNIHHGEGVVPSRADEFSQTVIVTALGSGSSHAPHCCQRGIEVKACHNLTDPGVANSHSGSRNAVKSSGGNPIPESECQDVCHPSHRA